MKVLVARAVPVFGRLVAVSGLAAVVQIAVRMAVDEAASRARELPAGSERKQLQEAR